MRTLKFLIFASLGLSVALGDEANLAKEVRLRKENGSLICEYLNPAPGPTLVWINLGKVQTLKAGSRLYHWGPESDVSNWAAHGISRDDIDRAVNAPDPHDAYGGGFYVSTDPFDSSMYGAKQLISELQHEAYILDVTKTGNYSAKYVAINDKKNSALIPIPLVAKAGIGAIRYYENWMVTIRGELLEKLFGASWQDFQETYGGDNEDLNQFLLFEQKYPLPEGSFQDAHFRSRFPGVTALEEDREFPEKIRTAWTLKFIDGLYGLRGLDAGTLNKLPLGRKGLEVVRPSLLAALRGEVEKAEKNSTSFDPLYEGNFFNNLIALGLTLHDVFPEFQAHWGEFFQWNNINTSGATSVNSSWFGELITAVLYDSFYDLLNAYNQDKPSPWLLPDTATTETGNLMTVVQFPKNADVYQNHPLLMVKALAPTKFVYRDSPEKKSEFLVSEFEKSDLDKTQFLTCKYRPAEGKPRFFYGECEYPTAANYRNYVALIQDKNLLDDLIKADGSHLLDSPGSAEFKALTARLLKYFAEDWTQPSDLSQMRKFQNFARLHAFRDTEFERMVLRIWLYFSGHILMSQDPASLETLSYSEILERSAFSAHETEWLYRYLTAFSNDYSNPAYALGFWEVAAGTMCPAGEDPVKFIEKLRAEFEAPQIQDLLKTHKYTSIQEKLRAVALRK